MLKKIIIGILFFFISFPVFSQNRANIWYFGEEVGLDFSNGSPVVITNSSMTAESGCSVICDKNGNLQFYTNGQKIWNRQHNIMPNGEGIAGSFLVNQNSVIIPKPNNEHIYYLLTVDTNGFAYSEIDMQLQNGLGDVVVKNNFITDNKVVEKITAIDHCNSKDIWIIVHKFESPEFFSYIVSDTGGVSFTPVISEAGSKVKADIGYLKASPTGDIIGLPVNSSNIYLELFDFDNLSGIISNPVKIYKNDNSYVYGIEFSANGKKLYISTGGETYSLIQYDLTLNTETEINNSATIIANGNIYALQVGTDSKIYIAVVNEPYLSIINYPNLKGLYCGYEEKKIYLNGKNCLMGLPDFNQSYFNKPSISIKNACVGEMTSFSFDYSLNIDSVKWNLGSNIQEAVKYDHPFIYDHKFNFSESYTVNLMVYHCEAIDTITENITIYQNPEVNLGSDTVVFQGNTIVLDAGDEMDNYLWNDGTRDQYLYITDTGTYWVEVFKNLCRDKDTINIEMIPVQILFPSAFSPNNDGANDIFRARVTGIVYDFQMAVFNRSGQRVFYSNDISLGWDGSNNGTQCQVNTYIWEISYTVRNDRQPELRKKTGYVHLIR
ncbi:MAG: gliding motility-associated C-terminal domain-containing protein [Bacteroidales bacterium]|nr:gliding motility-associated C-terminal domain-containing protein [Bacteroidales bacterium]